MIATINDKKISELFSIFHDGTISAWHSRNDIIELEIEIEYLAKRVSVSYSKFYLIIHNVRNFCFSTWPRDFNISPSLISDPDILFSTKPEILSSKFKNGLVEVAMGQDSAEYDYSGGVLSFKADDAIVTDESGKQYSITELTQICDDYWNKALK